MAKQKEPNLEVCMERLPNRRAVERVREAYRRLQQIENEETNQEAQHEPTSGNLCKSVDLATRAGSND